MIPRGVMAAAAMAAMGGVSLPGPTRPSKPRELSADDVAKMQKAEEKRRRRAARNSGMPLVQPERDAPGPVCDESPRDLGLEF